jgi:ribosome hibernation promoting factor
MRIHLTARHCELDPEDRLFTEQRLGKLSRFASDIQEAHVIVTAEKYRHIAEITVRTAGREVAGREEANEPRVAIERAVDRLEHQIRRLKDRRLERQRGDRTRASDQIAAPGEGAEEAGGPFAEE